jgi:hypothetical protein
VYHRPTIPWSLECEINNNFTRLDAIKYFKQRFQLVQQLPKLVASLAVPALIMIIVLPCRGFLEMKGSNGGMAMIIFFGGGFLIASCFMAKPTMIAWRLWQKQEA